MSGLWSQLSRRTDLPTYVGGWLAAMSWLTVVGSTVGDAAFNTLIYALTTGGFAVSLWLRGFIDTPQWPHIRRAVINPSATLRLVFFLGVVLPGLIGLRPFSAVIPEIALGTDDWLIGTGFMWGMALHSFGLVSDGLVAFGSVFGISMLGLMASSNVNPELGLAFLTFLLGNVLMLSNMTLAHHSQRMRKDGAGPTVTRWIGDQVIVAGLTVTITAVVSIAGGAVLQRVTSPLKPQIPKLNLPARLAASAAGSGYASFGDNMRVGVGGPENPARLMFRAWCDRPVLWRRRVYDTFSGTVWSSPPGGGTMLTGQTELGRIEVGPNLDKAGQLAARVPFTARVEYLESLDFCAPPLVVVLRLARPESLNGRVDLDRHDNVLLAVRAGTELTIESRLAVPTPDQLRAAPPVRRQEWSRLLKIPSKPAGMVQMYASRLRAGQSTPYDTAAAIQRWLESEFTYDVAARVPERGVDATEWYLESRHGACDLIATAMVLLARASGIPARVAVGYGAGAPEAGGSWSVHAADAHAWAELYFEGYGWLAFNPQVPAAAEDEIGAEGVAVSIGRLRLTRRQLAGLGALAALGWLLVYVLKHWLLARPRFASDPAGEIAKTYHEAHRRLARSRLIRRPSETASAFLKRVGPLAPPEAAAGLARLTALYEAGRYQWRAVDEHDFAAAREALKDLTRALSRRR